MPAGSASSTSISTASDARWASCWGHCLGKLRRDSVPEAGYGDDYRYGLVMGTSDRQPARRLELGYARVSTTRQSLERQLAARSEADGDGSRREAPERPGTVGG